jgi:hypothetical protein
MIMMRDEPTADKDKEKPIDKPRYRLSFETSADSPEELHKRLVKGLARHIKRKPGRRSRR